DTKTLDNQSMASVAGGVRLSQERLHSLEPGLRGWRGKLFDARLTLGSLSRLTAARVFAEHLMYGDAAPALVVSTTPFKVAAFAPGLDAVIMLAFEDAVRDALSQAPETGDRLLVINTYESMNEEGYAPGVIPGPSAPGAFRDAAPLIADWLTDDAARVQLIKRSFPEELWLHVGALASSYVEYFGEKARAGNPVAVCFS
ncbi:MAG: hypothetical protein AAGI01_15595, partial [Myxococcota bacterium]